MDDKLIDRAKQGDVVAIRALYDRNAVRVYAVVRRIAGDEAEAEDWAQEAWMRVFRALPAFRGEALFSTGSIGSPSTRRCMGSGRHGGEMRGWRG